MADVLQPSVDAQVELAKQKLAKEMPAQMQGTSIEPMGVMGRVFSALKGLTTGGNVQATTNPMTGNISYDPSALQGSSDTDVQDMLAHELTHTGQVRAQSWPERILGALKPNPYSYNQDPNEMAAYQAEQERAVSQGRTPTPKPGFLQPWQTMGDIQLPDQRLKAATTALQKR